MGNCCLESEPSENNNHSEIQKSTTTQQIQSAQNISQESDDENFDIKMMLSDSPPESNMKFLNRVKSDNNKKSNNNLVKVSGNKRQRKRIKQLRQDFNSAIQAWPPVSMLENVESKNNKTNNNIQQIQCQFPKFRNSKIGDLPTYRAFLVSNNEFIFVKPPLKQNSDEVIQRKKTKVDVHVPPVHQKECLDNNNNNSPIQEFRIRQV
jgi:hypothetical protein